MDLGWRNFGNLKSHQGSDREYGQTDERMKRGINNIPLAFLNKRGDKDQTVNINSRRLLCKV